MLTETLEKLDRFRSTFNYDKQEFRWIAAKTILRELRKQGMNRRELQRRTNENLAGLGIDEGVSYGFVRNHE